MRRTTLFALFLVASCRENELVSSYAATLTCEDGDFTLEAVTPEVMLVLDRSGSMNTSFGTSTRWTTLVSALETALPSVDSSMAMGLLLFPAASTSQQCAVPDSPELIPATNHVSAILSLLRTSTMVGGTPTAEALGVAARSLNTSGPRAMVLATDGLPNCNESLTGASCAGARCIDDARTLDVLSAQSVAGIPTWIIGIGDDVAANVLLDAMATAGGRPLSGTRKFAQAASSTELQSALISIRDELSACTFVSSSVPNGGGLASLTLDGVLVPEDASGVNGWTWSSQERGELVLRGEWCSRAIAATTPVVRLSVACAADDAGLVVAPLN